MRLALLPVLAGCLAALPLRGEEGAPVEKAPAEGGTEDASPEQALRQRFLIAYQTGRTPDRKAEAVEMLRGAKEQATLRLITGMLGDSSELVRRKACAVMAATADPDGYFVKPLMGMLTDRSQAVRLAAAEALGAATVRGDAIKALTFALAAAAGSSKPDNAVADARLIDAYDRALQKLTGEKSEARDARALGAFWMDYWRKRGTEIQTAERQAREKEPPPRPQGLPKDSFDQ
ncbi:MAG: HEAT repeat domain-containing protein [Planctomycetota bacterium]|nr:HEAT repeat domain-containing protein [Planctomycetota bacterium]